MHNFEFNKVFAAFLVAGIVAMLSGFISDGLVAPKAIAEDAVHIEAASGGGAGAAAAKVEAPEPILGLIAAADVAKGEKLSKACAACHSFDNGGANKVGPHLFGIVGGEKGKVDGFSYSASLAKMGGVWDYAALNHFLFKPKAYVTGTKMTFAGIKKTEDRAALIAWLRTMSSAPAALPSEADIAKEKAELAPPAAPEEGKAEEKTPEAAAPAEKKGEIVPDENAEPAKH